MLTSSADCKGCRASVRLSPGEVPRIVADYLRSHPGEPLATSKQSATRLTICHTCSELRYGTTCTHCGCLVEVMVRLERRRCPRPEGARW